jgi:environmental stress-induced protein Ves
MARFAGDEPVFCTLRDGPCQDFNIMVDRARARADVSLYEAAFSGQAASRTLWHALEGDWVFSFDGDEQALPAGGLVLLTDEAGKPFWLRGEGVLLWINIEVFDHGDWSSLH